MVTRLRAALLMLFALTLAACTPSTPTANPSAPPIVGSAKTTPPAPAVVEPADTTPDPLPAGPVNALFIGTDSRDPSSLTGNADIIMLVHVPADRESLALISFTRDMWVPIPGIGEGKINSAFSRGGTDTLKQTVVELLGGGIDIDYTLQTNFNGFIAITRALDGFTVDNKNASTVTVQSTGRVLDFAAGELELTGTDGLIYVRQRKGLPLGDLDRTERQRAAVIGILDRIAERTAQDPVGATADLLPMLLRNVKLTGDLDLQGLIGLLPLAQNLTRDDVVSLMVPITGFGTRAKASVNLIDEAQTAALGQALRDDDIAGYVEAFGTGYAP